ncbi:MAG: YggT family protein [Treponema sp.]|nr:YggT family protein [Treponema sp.]
MRILFGLLAALAGIYSLFIFIRIILSWFSKSSGTKLESFLQIVTDPYLNWWKKNLNLRIASLDFSVVAAIVTLSLLQTIFHSLYISGSITIGNILAIVLFALWSIVSFIAGFCVVIIVLRAIAYFTNRNIYSRFWGTVDSISQPILYRMNRIIYGNKTGNYLKGMIFSVLILTGIIIAGRFLVMYLANILRALPF